ncbi:MAG: CsbD family protein [Negativicutes bacterium]|nr:CsbD family protein [Negativicutes bacterium]
MNDDILKGKWHELKGGVKEKWGKLTDDDLTAVNGKAEKLVGLLQTKYGYSKDKAEEEYNGFIGDHKKQKPFFR